MRQIEIAGRVITDDDVFIIAEIGSNHQGDPDLCEQMIKTAAMCGVDAVKMQKRDSSMLTKTARAKPYPGPNSFGKTYGEHRDALDWFGEKEFRRFKAVADKHGVLFFATPFTPKDADFLNDLGMPLWKIASCDATNTPFIKKVAGYGDPLIISTGGASLNDIYNLANSIEMINPNFALLQCTSVYNHVTDSMMNLNVITKLREEFPSTVVGLSSHHPGILPLVVARTLRASIFEVHFTLDRNMKGTDHSFSMEWKGLRNIVEDLKRIDAILGEGDKRRLEEEEGGFVYKMGKGVYLSHSMKAGDMIDEDDIVIKAPAGALRPDEAYRVIGHPLLIDVSTGVDLNEGMVE